jgi:hypothetical protein
MKHLHDRLDPELYGKVVEALQKDTDLQKKEQQPYVRCGHYQQSYNTCTGNHKILQQVHIYLAYVENVDSQLRGRNWPTEKDKKRHSYKDFYNRVKRVARCVKKCCNGDVEKFLNEKLKKCPLPNYPACKECKGKQIISNKKTVLHRPSSRSL